MNRRRSIEPLFWSLFGAGGMLSALVAAPLMGATGLLAPLAAPEALDRARVLALVTHPAGALGLWAVVSLFLWHACHRLLHGLHDLGFHPGVAGRWVFYGAAALGTLATAALLLAAGGLQP